MLPYQRPRFSVSALGPINVQLRLGNGLCLIKGCNEGMCTHSWYPALFGDGISFVCLTHSGCGLQLFLYGCRLPCEQSLEGQRVRGGQTYGQDWSQPCPLPWSLLDHHQCQSSQHATVGPSDQRVTANPIFGLPAYAVAMFTLSAGPLTVLMNYSIPLFIPNSRFIKDPLSKLRRGIKSSKLVKNPSSRTIQNLITVSNK